MKFSKKLIGGQFIKRYKRFFVDVRLPCGTVVVAHCPNTGSMKGLLVADAPVWLSEADDPNRKLRYTLEMIEIDGFLVGVHTGRPNKLVAEAVLAGHVPELLGYSSQKAEVVYGVAGKSRIDLLLSDPVRGLCYVEVKNTTLKEGEAALFPDAVTQRGSKHLAELVAEVQKGNRAVMFYLVNRADCAYFRVADNIDPVYAAALKAAMAAGVEVLAYCCALSPEEIVITEKMEVTLS